MKEERRKSPGMKEKAKGKKYRWRQKKNNERRNTKKSTNEGKKSKKEEKQISEKKKKKVRCITGSARAHPPTHTHTHTQARDRCACYLHYVFASLRRSSLINAPGEVIIHAPLTTLQISPLLHFFLVQPLCAFFFSLSMPKKFRAIHCLCVNRRGRDGTGGKLAGKSF